MRSPNDRPGEKDAAMSSVVGGVMLTGMVVVLMSALVPMMMQQAGLAHETRAALEAERETARLHREAAEHAAWCAANPGGDDCPEKEMPMRKPYLCTQIAEDVWICAHADPEDAEPSPEEDLLGEDGLLADEDPLASLDPGLVD